MVKKFQLMKISLNQLIQLRPNSTFGELLTGAAVGYVALSLVGAALPYIVGGFILVAFLASGSNGYYGLG